MTEPEQSKTVTIGDQPTKEDTLGFQPYVIAIAKFLTAPDTKPPLTISIEGEWGRGKSSFMKQLQTRILEESTELEEESTELEKQELENASWFKKVFLWVKFKLKQKTQIVEFNAWRHNKAESLWAAFALSFLEQISTTRQISDFVGASQMCKNIKVRHLSRKVFAKDAWESVGLRNSLTLKSTGGLSEQYNSTVLGSLEGHCYCYRPKFRGRFLVIYTLRVQRRFALEGNTDA